MHRQPIRRTIERVLELGGLGAAVFAAGLLLGGLLVFGLHEKHWLPNSGSRQVEAFSDVGEQQAGQLAERFRPWLLFDSHEPWRPLNVSALLDEGTHRFCTRVAKRAGCKPIADARAFDAQTKAAGALGPATYLDLGGGSVRDYHGPERCAPLLDCGVGAASAIYYHVTQSNDRFYVDYWWFLRFNHFPRSLPGVSCQNQAARENDVCDEHEGDWEGVTVVTPPDNQDRIDYVVYAAHRGTFRYTASELHLRYGTRPVVYVAQGSHASYPAPCAHDCSQPSGLAANGLVNLPEGDFDGRGGWARNAQACPPDAAGTCLLSLDAQTWTTWPGEWGAGCGQACGGALDANSPHSPGLQARYQTPWCSTQNGVFTCDSRTLQCSDWLGPLVAVVACDPALLSKGLRASNAVEPGRLALTVDGIEHSQATTPGVVQLLSAPLRPGHGFTVDTDGPATQILVRAEQAGTVEEDRFAGLPVREGQAVAITIARGPDGPTVRADGIAPVERRILAGKS